MPLVVFTCLAFALSWAWWLWLLAHGLRVAPGANVTHLPGLLGPAIAALLTVAVFEGRGGVLSLLSGLWGPARRMSPASGATAMHPAPSPAPDAAPAPPLSLRPALLVMAIAAPPVLSLATVIGRALATGQPLPPLSDFTAYPGILPGWTGLLALLAVVVLNGLGEELGWRGFAQDRLAHRFGRVRGTLVLTLVWAAWHLPLFWLNTSMTALIGPMLLGWLFSLACGAFALADLYWSSRRHLWLVILWHSGYNAVVATPATDGLPAAVVSVFVVVWGIDAARRFHLADRADRFANHG